MVELEKDANMNCLKQEFCWAHLQQLRLTRTQLDPPASWGTQTATWVWGEVPGTNYLHKQGTALKDLEIVTAREIWNFKKPDIALALWQPCFGELWKIHQKNASLQWVGLNSFHHFLGRKGFSWVQELKKKKDGKSLSQAIPQGCYRLLPDYALKSTYWCLVQEECCALEQ